MSIPMLTIAALCPRGTLLQAPIGFTFTCSHSQKVFVGCSTRSEGSGSPSAIHQGGRGWQVAYCCILAPPQLPSRSGAQKDRGWIIQSPILVSRGLRWGGLDLEVLSAVGGGLPCGCNWICCGACAFQSDRGRGGNSSTPTDGGISAQRDPLSHNPPQTHDVYLDTQAIHLE